MELKSQAKREKTKLGTIIICRFNSQKTLKLIKDIKPQIQETQQGPSFV